jgi:hypothetical protein
MCQLHHHLMPHPIFMKHTPHILFLRIEQTKLSTIIDNQHLTVKQYGENYISHHCIIRLFRKSH